MNITRVVEVDIVVGGGRYGAKAVKHLLDENKGFVVLDPDPKCVVMREFRLKEVGDVKEVKGGCFLKGGIEKLSELVLKLKPDYVFPTAPVHVVAEALRIRYKMKPWNGVLGFILAGLPSKIVISAGRGNVVVSYNRDGDCIEDCPAPDVCPVTKTKKPCPIYELIRFSYPEVSLMVSHQLKPGLGAISGRDFANLIREVEKKDRVVTATACRCHGIITALTR